MKSFLLCASLLNIPAIGHSVLASETRPRCDAASSSVTGSGSNYNDAYRDAQNRLPTGAQVSEVRTRQDGKIWYVTIFYRTK